MNFSRLLCAVALVLVCSAVTGAQELPSFVGYIAYVGNDHNVYVVDAAHTPTALTADATADRRYQFPTWSNDGRLAFFCCEITFSSGLVLETYLASPDMTRAKLLYAAENEGYTYSAWSPSNCDAGPTCRDLAVLVTQAGMPFKVELIRSNGTDITSRTAATGAPFYFSWNRDGARMIWHRNAHLLSFFDAALDADAVDLQFTASGFQAPAFSPVDDRAAMVVLEDSGQTNAILIVDGDEIDAVVGGIPAALRGSLNVIAISWSPDGRALAYRAINRFGASPLYVIDAETGAVLATSGIPNVLAFFWSPDSRKLAYLTPGEIAGDVSLSRVAYQRISRYTWSALDVRTNTSQPLASFVPSPSMMYLLAYFDQFNQSHQLWSPDSRYIVYADTSDGGASSVKILDTTAGAPVPLTVASGEIGIWSYH